MIFLLLLLVLCAMFNVTMIAHIEENSDYFQLDAYTWESEDFRSMRLGELITSQDSLDYDQLTTLMVANDYDLTALKHGEYSSKSLLTRRPQHYNKLKKAYETVLADLVYFPIPKNSKENSPNITFENGWKDPRSYGGERNHEGCDLMGNEKPRGYYPVCSMSDGVVEKVGWLEKGGWRIGIRTPGGAYLYYAHLYGYSQDFKPGDPVRAGQLLGFMGDSGYGEKEGTVGNFDVHLHVGIYIRTDHYEELSINPYWALKYLEKKRLTAAY